MLGEGLGDPPATGVAVGAGVGVGDLVGLGTDCGGGGAPLGWSVIVKVVTATLPLSPFWVAVTVRLPGGPAGGWNCAEKVPEELTGILRTTSPKPAKLMLTVPQAGAGSVQKPLPSAWMT